jgi:transposase
VTPGHLPGRPGTDTLDAVWLCKLAERGMLPAQLRAATTDPPAAGRGPLPGRAGGGADRERRSGWSGLPGDAQIKLSVVASDVFGVPGGPCSPALLAGERDPKALAQLAQTRLRAKLGPSAEAFTGFFTDQHAFLLRKMLGRVDALDADNGMQEARGSNPLSSTTGHKPHPR